MQRFAPPAFAKPSAVAASFAKATEPREAMADRSAGQDGWRASFQQIAAAVTCAAFWFSWRSAFMVECAKIGPLLTGHDKSYSEREPASVVSCRRQLQKLVWCRRNNFR